MFNINGPTLLRPRSSTTRDTPPDAILDASTREIETAAHDARRPGHAGPSRSKMRSRLYDKMEDLVRLRPGRPAGVLRAVRRRPGADQQARGGVRARSRPALHPEDGAGVSAPRPIAPCSPCPASPSHPRSEASRNLRRDDHEQDTQPASPLAAPRRSRSRLSPRRPRRKRRRRRRPPETSPLPAPKTFIARRTASASRSCPTATCRRSTVAPVRGRGQQQRAGRGSLARPTSTGRADARRHHHAARAPQIAERRGADGRRGRHRRVGDGHRSARRDRALGVRPRTGAARGRRGQHPKFPASGLDRLKARQPAAALDREEPAAADRAGEVPRDDLRRSSLRTGLPDRGACCRATPLAQARGFYDGQLRRGRARASTWPAASTPAAMEAADPGRASAAGSSGADVDPAAARSPARSARSTSWTSRARCRPRLIVGLPVIDPSHPDWDRARGHEQRCSAATSPRASPRTSASRRATPTRRTPRSRTGYRDAYLGGDRRRHAPR